MLLVTSTHYAKNHFIHIAQLLSTETGGSNRFPDEASIAVEDYKYFISDVNFEAIPGKLLVGAA